MGVPVVLTAAGEKHSVICEPGKELEALELLEKMGIIKLMRPENGRRPDGTLKPFDEKQIAGVAER